MKLHEQRDHLLSTIEGARLTIYDFRRHLNSRKFNCGDRLDGYINVSDVHQWLQSILDALNEER